MSQVAFGKTWFRLALIIVLLNFDMTTVGVAGTVTWDRRGNATMPEKGQLIDFSVWRYGDAIGSDFE